MLALVLALPDPAAAAALGDPIDEALAVHVTNIGLTHLGDAVQKLVPTEFPVEDVTGEFACGEDDATPLTYSLEAMDLLLSADDVQLVTSDGRLDLWLYATLSSTAATLVVTGDCSVLTDLDETCGVQIPTTAVEAHLGMTIAENEGVFDVTVDAVELDISPITNPLSDCTLASAIGTMLGQDEEAITNLIVGLVEPALADVGPTIEEALEDPLNSLALSTEFSLLDANLALSLYPSLVELGDDGIVLGMGAQVQVDATSDCVDWSGGSDLSGSGWPDFGATAADTSLQHDAALYVGADFVDHLLYTVWATGLLCVDVGDFIEGGLGTGVLGGMLGEEFQALFPEDRDTLLFTEPVQVPTVAWAEDGPPVRVVLEDLGLPLYAPLDDRDARVFQVDVAAEIAVDVYLGEVETGDTGAPVSDGIVTELVFDTDDLVLDESYSDLLDPGYSEGLRSLMDTVLGSLIPSDALPRVAIPDLMGIRLGSLIWMPVEDGDWQGGFLLLDTTAVEPIQVPACSVDGLGCDGGGSDISFEDLLGCSEGGGLGCDPAAGCEGSSCSAAGPLVAVWRGRLLLLVGLALAFGARRRA